MPEQVGLQAILDDKNFQDGLKRYSQGIAQMSSATDHGANVLTGLGKVMEGALVVGVGAATAALAGFLAISKTGLDAALQWSESLDALGDQFGMTGTEASAWAVAMQHVGLSVEEGSAGLNFFTRNLDDVKKAMATNKVEVKDNSEKVNKLKEQLADANVQLQRAQKNLAGAKKPTDQMKYAVEDAQKKVSRLNAELAATPKTITKVKDAAVQLTPFQKALDQLGVKAFDAKGKLKTFDQVMPEIMDAFQKLPAGVNASALAMDLFGARGGTKFLDFLRQGSAGLKDAAKFAEEFGLEIESDGVNAAEEFGFAMNDLNLALKGLWVQVGSEVLPIARQLVDYIRSDVLPILSAWAKDTLPILRQSILDTISAIKTWWDANGARIIQTITAGWDMLAKWWKDNKGSITGAIQEVISKLGEFKTYLETEVPPALDVFYLKIGQLKATSDQWNATMASMLSAVQNWLKGTNDAASVQLPTLADIVGFVMDSINQKVVGVTTILTNVMRAWQALTELDWLKFSSAVRGIFNGLFTMLFSMVGLNFSLLENQFTTWLQGIVDQVNGYVTQIQNAFASMFSFGGNTRALGGPVQAGQPYLVGERGPEPFIPATNGFILPHATMPALSSLLALPAQGGGRVMNFYNYAPIYGVNDLQRTMARAIEYSERH